MVAVTVRVARSSAGVTMRAPCCCRTRRTSTSPRRQRPRPPPHRRRSYTHYCARTACVQTSSAQTGRADFATTAGTYLIYGALCRISKFL